MDTNDHGNRERDELRQTAVSPSPSALSTASSGSPLVRGSSAIGAPLGGRRPAPTSIAAAQLQCQQQQHHNQNQRQLEFTNKLQQATESSSSKHKARGQSKVTSPSLARGEWQACGAERRSGHKSPTPNKSQQAAGKTARDTKTLNDGNINNNNEPNKSLGYSVAKSIAYKAHRFNEIWSHSRMRYLNLACFLMTIICLATILILSSGKTNLTSNITVANHPASSLKHRATGHHLTAPNNNNNNQSTESSVAESLDSLAREPLVGGWANNKQPDDDFNVSDGEPQTNSQEELATRSSVRRRLAQEALEQEYDREAATAATIASPGPSTNEPPTETGTTSDSWPTPSLSRFIQHDSPMDPILGQILHEMDFGHMLRPPSSSSRADSKGLATTTTTTINGTSGQAPITLTSTVLKPIIRRNKNGATIIIQGSSSTAGSAFGPRLNESAPPSAFIERLLPPWMRPPSQHPVMSMMMMMRPPGMSISEESPSFMGAAASEALEQLASKPPKAGHYPQRGPLGDMSPFRSPLGMPMMPFMVPPMMAAPPILPPGLMSLLMRAQMLGDDSMDPLDQPHEPEEPSQLHESSQVDGATRNATGNDQQAASSAHNTSTILNNNNNNKSHNSTNKLPGKQPTIDGAPDSLLESLMMMANSPVEMSIRQPSMRHAILSGQPLVRASSPLATMFIISSKNSNGSNSPSSNGIHPFGPMGPFPLPTPFMRPPPHMILMGGEPTGQSPPMGALSPVMRSILSTVISDIQGPVMANQAAGESANKSGTASQKGSVSAPSSTNLNPSWMSSPSGQPSVQQSSPAPIDPDDEWTGIGDSVDRWDESSTGVQQQGRNLRARHRELETEGPMDEPSFALEPVQGSQQHEQMGGLSESPMGTASIRQSIRGPGLTLERVIEVPARAHQQQHDEVGLGVRSQSLSRSDSGENPELGLVQGRVSLVHRRPFFGGSLFASPRSDELEQPTGFIGRLLTDLTRGRGAEEGQVRTGRSRSAIDEDLEEGDSSSDGPMGSSSWAPKVRIATARIRMRPLFAEQRSSSSPGLPIFAATRLGLPDWANQEIQERADTLPTRSHQSMDELPASGASEPVDEPPNEKPAIQSNEKQAQQVERIQLRPRGMSPNQPLPVASPVQTKISGDNAYTSPSSPFFGFPASIKPKKDTKPLPSPPVAGNNSKTKESDSKATEAKPSFRQQRSFVYHSNTEPATAFNQAKAMKVNANDDQDILPRSRSAEMSSILHSQSFGLPANVVMGRRLDDQPNGSDQVEA